MTGSGERPEETRQSVDARQLREQMFNQLAERCRYRPLKRWLMVEAGRNAVVLVGGGVASLAFLLPFSCIFLAELKTSIEDWASWQPPP